jgi:hypothetical protein
VIQIPWRQSPHDDATSAKSILRWVRAKEITPRNAVWIRGPDPRKPAGEDYDCIWKTHMSSRVVSISSSTGAQHQPLSTSRSQDTPHVLPTPSGTLYRTPQHRRCKVRKRNSSPQEAQPRSFPTRLPLKVGQLEEDQLARPKRKDGK